MPEATIQPLWYQNRSMSDVPSNVSWDLLLRKLSPETKLGSSGAYVELEPGDGTRYEFAITAMPTNSSWGGGLVVVRVSGGEAVGTPAILYPHMSKEYFLEQTAALAGPELHRNQWTVKFAQWWLVVLMLHLGWDLSAAGGF